MAFDLSTAKPFEEKKPKGFDLSTATEYQSKEVTQNIATDDIFYGLPPETVDKIKSEQTLTGRGSGANPARYKRAADLERLRLKSPEQAKMVESMSTMEAIKQLDPSLSPAVVGMGEGFTSIGRGLGIIDPVSEDEQEIAQQLRDVHPSAQAGKFVGQAAPFMVPGAAAANLKTLPARMGAMGVIGATEGGLISKGEGGTDEDILKGAGIGLLFGILGEASMPIANSLGRKYAKWLKKGKISDEVLNKVNITPDGQPSEEFAKILDESDVEFDDFARQTVEGFDDPVMNAQREKAFRDLGLDPTEAQRTRDTDLFVQQQDAARRAGPVKNCS